LTEASAAAADSAWTLLAGAGMCARVLRVLRGDIAFFKFLFESYEGVAIIRTVETLDDGHVLIAVLATPDFAAETDAILDDVNARGTPPFTSAALPPACTEDWFLSTWVRDAGGDD
jgi:hypothetical protein